MLTVPAVILVFAFVLCFRRLCSEALFRRFIIMSPVRIIEWLLRLIVKET